MTSIPLLKCKGRVLFRPVARLFLCGAVLQLLANNTMAQPPGKGYKLLYEDNFEGDALNTKDWKYRVGRRTGLNINGMNLEKNVSVSDGLLRIAVNREWIDGKPENTGGGVISRIQFGYGYYETKSRPFMAGTGVHSSFWQAGGAVPNNDIFEIDSYEIDSKHFMGCNNLYLHISPKGKEVPWVTRANVPFKFNKDGWFVDGYEYTPEGVIYYDNGQEVARAYWDELTAAQVVWLTGLNGVGKVDSTAFPGETVFDYFRYYAKDYPGVNILPNGNFEYNQDRINPETPVAWHQEGSPGGIVVEGNAFRDRYKLRQGNAAASYEIRTSQSLEYIMNGDYMISARVRSSGGQKLARIEVAGYGGKELSVAIPASEKWTKVTIPRIAVANNKVKITIHSGGEAGQWLEVDDIQFLKPGLAGQKSPKPKPFVLIGDPIWEQAKKAPIEFKGDEKFYFFSRNVGFGDSIALSFSFNSEFKTNTSPIARLPKTGNSGWAVLLSEKGDIIFRIGSAENHRDVLAPNAYEAGKETSLICMLSKGTAKIYVDGRLLKTETGISQDAKDPTAAGRLGNTGEIYHAIGDVIVKNEPAHTVRPELKGKKSAAYTGTIRNLEIFNRALSEREIAGKFSRISKK